MIGGGLITRANPLSSSAIVDVLDDILLTLGDNSDGVLVLNTAGLSADEELAGVIEGTSDTLGTAANSLLIANITDDGDIAILVSKAGNSHTAFWADGSTGDTALMAASGASLDLYVAGTKEYEFTATELDMNINNITNMGIITFVDNGVIRTGADNGYDVEFHAYENGAHVLLMELKSSATTAYIQWFRDFNMNDTYGIKSGGGAGDYFYFGGSTTEVARIDFDTKGLIFADTRGIYTQVAAADYFTLTARKTDATAAWQEVARVSAAATDTFFATGGSQQNKFYNSGRAELKSIVGYGTEADLTISGGIVAITQTYHSIITQGGADDQLDTATGGSEGDILILKSNLSGTNGIVTVANATGSDTFILAGGANFVLDHIDDRLMCIHNGTEWVEISRSSNS